MKLLSSHRHCRGDFSESTMHFDGFVILPFVQNPGLSAGIMRKCKAFRENNVKTPPQGSCAEQTASHMSDSILAYFTKKCKPFFAISQKKFLHSAKRLIFRGKSCIFIQSGKLACFLFCKVLRCFRCDYTESASGAAVKNAGTEPEFLCCSLKSECRS